MWLLLTLLAIFLWGGKIMDADSSFLIGIIRKHFILSKNSWLKISFNANAASPAAAQFMIIQMFPENGISAREPRCHIYS